jgi:hypothetical protein
MVLQMGANGASGRELQIAPKNRFHTNFLRKLWTYHFLFSPYFIAVSHEMYSIYYSYIQF